MSAYADTSFLVSLYLFDVHSEAASARMKRADLPLPLTPLAEFELLNAIWLRVFRRDIPASEAKAAQALVQRDIEDGVWVRKPMPAIVYERAMQMARRRTPHLGTRAFDVLHVAAALLLRADVFYTFDRTQGLLAKAEGLTVL